MSTRLSMLTPAVLNDFSVMPPRLALRSSDAIQMALSCGWTLKRGNSGVLGDGGIVTYFKADNPEAEYLKELSK